MMPVLPTVRTAARRVKRWFRREAVVLLYHRVTELPVDTHSLCVTPQHFGEQLEVIKRDYQPLSMPQLVRALQRGGVPRRAVVVTFDDGYADNLYEARPLLEHHGVPATVFLTSGDIGRKREFWWDELERIVLCTDPLPSTLQLRVAGRDYQWELNGASDASRERLHMAIHGLLLELPHEQREPILDELLVWSGASGDTRATHRALSREEISRLAAGESMEIGAHTVTHPSLPVQDVEHQQDEIRACKASLEELVGRPVQSFSYPYGFHSDQTVELVREAGYESAFICDERTVHNMSDPFRLPRFIVRDWDGDEFSRKLHEWRIG
jgi:peptidoglycan/xylan/chitin deacetylase (PgdA/CDA1 family)